MPKYGICVERRLHLIEEKKKQKAETPQSQIRVHSVSRLLSNST